MSDIIQKIISSDTITELSTDFVDDAIAFINNNYGDVDVEYIDYEEVTFIDCGGNLEVIKCDVCDEILSKEWWGSKMSLWYEEGEMNVLTPCCNSETTLNDLSYFSDCGFSRFEFRMLNPTEFINVEHFSFHSGIEFKSVISRV